MNSLQIKKIVIPIMIFLLAAPLSRAQSFDRPASRQHRSASHKKPLRHKNVKGPASIEKVKKQQEEKESKRQKDYSKYVKENQQRSLEIQTPAVRERMKRNIKDANANFDAKHKSSASRTRKAGKKYR